jgi:hypothetical protein
MEHLGPISSERFDHVAEIAIMEAPTVVLIQCNALKTNFAGENMPQSVRTRILSKNLSSKVTLSRIQKAYCLAPEKVPSLNQKL